MSLFQAAVWETKSKNVAILSVYLQCSSTNKRIKQLRVKPQGWQEGPLSGRCQSKQVDLTIGSSAELGSQRDEIRLSHPGQGFKQQWWAWCLLWMSAWSKEQRWTDTASRRLFRCVGEKMEVRTQSGARGRLVTLKPATDFYFQPLSGAAPVSQSADYSQYPLMKGKTVFSSHCFTTMLPLCVLKYFSGTCLKKKTQQNVGPKSLSSSVDLNENLIVATTSSFWQQQKKRKYLDIVNRCKYKTSSVCNDIDMKPVNWFISTQKWKSKDKLLCDSYEFRSTLLAWAKFSPIIFYCV